MCQCTNYQSLCISVFSPQASFTTRVLCFLRKITSPLAHQSFNVPCVIQINKIKQANIQCEMNDAGPALIMCTSESY